MSPSISLIVIWLQQWKIFLSWGTKNHFLIFCLFIECSEQRWVSVSGDQNLLFRSSAVHFFPTPSWWASAVFGRGCVMDKRSNVSPTGTMLGHTGKPPNKGLAIVLGWSCGNIASAPKISIKAGTKPVCSLLTELQDPGDTPPHCLAIKKLIPFTTWIPGVPLGLWM